ncbi:MAG: aminotransferase class V-fold PLP-dependent enzyme [Ferrovibrio sp.]
MLDIDRLRAETPGCAIVTHFNHSSCSLPSAAMTRCVIDHLERESRDGPSEAGAAVQPAVQDTRIAAAALLNCSAEEIALMGSGSHGWGMAFAALPPLQPGDRILTGRHEWGGNLNLLHLAAAKAGASVEIIPCTENGAVSPEALSAMIDSRVRLIALTWVPANSGLINPAAEIGKIARAAGIPYFIDAGQALGQVLADVQALGCDVLKGAGRKYLRGPRGTALLYIRRDFLDQLQPAYVDVASASWNDGRPQLRGDARRFETAENGFAQLLGFGVAIRQALALGVPAIRSRIAGLRAMMAETLGGIAGVTLHELGDRAEQSSILAFTTASRAPADLQALLARDRINIAAIAAAYTPLDMQARGLAAINRASVSYFTTEAEIDRLAAAIRKAL